MTISPRTRHLLEQFMALNLEVQAMLRTHKEALIREGWHPAEAWAFCQRVEERILGPAMQTASEELAIERRVEEAIAAEKARLKDPPK